MPLLKSAMHVIWKHIPLVLLIMLGYTSYLIYSTQTTLTYILRGENQIRPSETKELKLIYNRKYIKLGKNQFSDTKCK